jgi:hypothetical protein
MSEGGQVNANLVGAAGFEPQFEKGVVGKPFNRLVVSDGGLALAGRYDCEAQAIDGMPPDRPLQHPVLRIRHAVHQRLVQPVNRMLP